MISNHHTRNHWIALGITLSVIALLSVGLAARSVQAQDGDPLVPNDPVIISVAASDTVSRPFALAAGDSIELRLSPLSDFPYQAALIDPAGQLTTIQSGSSDDTIYTESGVATGGTYTLVLQASAPGGSLLVLLLVTPGEAPPPTGPPMLTTGETSFEASGDPFSFILPPSDEFGVLQLSAAQNADDSATTIGLPGLTLVEPATGQVVLSLAPGILPDITFTLPPDREFELLVEPDPLAPPVDVVVVVTGLDQPPGQAGRDEPPGQAGRDQPPATDVAETDAATPIPTPTPFSAETPTPSATFTVTNTVTAPQAPVQNTATPTATATFTATASNTPTFTPSFTPTTPPAAQIAPADPRFNNPLNIPLDNTASVLDFVSYPGGDTEDRVAWDITGMNQNASSSGGQAHLVIAVSCFGENIDQVQFFTGGQTFTCGQTIVDREVTYDSRTGSVVITAIGGEGTYVQWVLTGTATRVN